MYYNVFRLDNTKSVSRIRIIAPQYRHQALSHRACDGNSAPRNIYVWPYRTLHGPCASLSRAFSSSYNAFCRTCGDVRHSADDAEEEAEDNDDAARPLSADRHPLSSVVIQKLYFWDIAIGPAKTIMATMIESMRFIVLPVIS